MEMTQIKVTPKKSPNFRKSRFTDGLSKQALKSKRRQNALSKQTIRRQIERGCICQNNCSLKLSCDDIMRWRQRIHRLPNGQHRNTELISLIRQCSTSLRKHAKCTMYRVEQQVVCRHFFVKTVLGLSLASFSRIFQKVNEGKFHASTPEKKTGSVQGSRGMTCLGFLRAYMESSCDRDPSGKLYRMAVSMTRQDLYGLYSTVYGDNRLKPSQFYDILKTRVPELRFNKTQQHTKCSECLEYRALIETETNPEERAKLIETRNIHLMQQQLEREAYYVRRAQAEMMPTRYFSVILDGMDQHKTDLPHYQGWNDPNNAGSRKIKTHIVGGIAHGRGKYFFVDVNEYPHDTNLTLSCLVKILKLEAKENKLPATLYVQLDNTTRENKNKYFLGMMAYLVKKHYIRECYMSFLIVGHTHEDVDQSFSKISHVLKKTTVLTQNALLETVERSQEQTTAAFQTDVVWNISEWLTPFINQVHNITFPKLYRIFEDHVGHVTVQYRRYSCDEIWRPLPTERPLEIFKLNAHSEQMIPPNAPDIVQPSLDQEDLRETKRSMRSKDYTLAQFDADSVQQWDSFFENPCAGRPQQPEWPLSTLETTEIIEPTSTLTAKQKEVVLAYQRKRQEFKEVYTAQPTGTRGEWVDRRAYDEGDMVVGMTKESRGIVGKITEVHDTTLEIKVYVKDQSKWRVSREKMTILKQCVLPGGFQLTTSGKVPRAVLTKIANAQLII